MYHAIDLYCVRHADEVWSVSTRICEVRRKIGLAEEKMYLFLTSLLLKDDSLQA